jgi:hypothetical protein
MGYSAIIDIGVGNFFDPGRLVAAGTRKDCRERRPGRVQHCIDQNGQLYPGVCV